MPPLDPLSRPIPQDDDALKDASALCLSGGGYRAMIFHLGAIWRLNELGLLHSLDRISSVSGGSLTAATLGMNWSRLQWVQRDGRQVAQNLEACLIQPVRAMARVSIDTSSVVWGIFSAWSTINDQIIAQYDQHLFHQKTLADLPDSPRFVINATNVKTGALWRFSKPYMGDWRTGLVLHPHEKLSLAVAASSAFPPFLSPCRFKVDLARYDLNSGGEFNTAGYRSEIVLSDGGVYDNLGLEPVLKSYKTIFVSDGGRPMAPQESPASDWAYHSRRLIDLLERQVTSLRRQQIVDLYQAKARLGTYWGIRTDIRNYKLDSAIVLKYGQNQRYDDFPPISDLETRLTAISDADQERLINWGYAISDAGLRKYYFTQQPLPRPASIPYPNTGF